MRPLNEEERDAVTPVDSTAGTGFEETIRYPDVAVATTVARIVVISNHPEAYRRE